MAIVTDVSEPPPEPGVSGPTHAWRALRTPVDVVLPNGVTVLNADDPAAVRMAEFRKAKVLYFAESLAAAPLAQHLAEDGSAVVLEEGAAVLRQGASRSELVDAETLSAARLPGLTVTPADWLALLAAGIAFGMTVEAVSSGFSHEFDGRPARASEREATGVATVG